MILTIILTFLKAACLTFSSHLANRFSAKDIVAVSKSLNVNAKIVDGVEASKKSGS